MKDSYALYKNKEVINSESCVKLVGVEKLTISFFWEKHFHTMQKS